MALDDVRFLINNIRFGRGLNARPLPLAALVAVDDRKGHRQYSATFGWFIEPQPEAVIRRFETAGLLVERYHHNLEQRCIEVLFALPEA